MNKVTDKRVLLTLLVAIILGGLLLLVPGDGTNRTRSFSTNEVIPTALPTRTRFPSVASSITPTPFPTPTEVSTWRVLINRQAGYSVRYPSNWHILIEQTNDEELSLVRFSPAPFFVGAEEADFENIEVADLISIMVIKNPSNLSIEETIDQQTDVQNILLTPVLIDGITGKRSLDIPGESNNDDVFVSHGGRIYRFILNMPGLGTRISTETYNQILSTVEFLN